jgi:hypothetical protein
MGESNQVLDTSALMTALNSVGESIKGFIGEMLPFLLGIATAALVLYFGIWAFRMIKKWFSKGA